MTEPDEIIHIDEEGVVHSPVEQRLEGLARWIRSVQELLKVTAHSANNALDLARRALATQQEFPDESLKMMAALNRRIKRLEEQMADLEERTP